MAKDNNEANRINNNLSTPSSSTGNKSQRNARSKPYDANNSFVKKVATKVTDLIPQPSWISKWFNSSQDEAALQATETDSPQYEAYEEKPPQPPPMKRPCIRMDVMHPPGTFTIKPSRSRSAAGDAESSKAHFSNHNETTQDFLEPTEPGRVPRFVSSTPAFSAATSSKVPDTRPMLNLLISEQNNNGAANGVDDNSETSESTSGCSSLIPQNNRQEAPNTSFNSFVNRRRYVDNKLDFTNHLQSPRSLFLDNSARDTLSSRQPSFNPRMVTNKLDRSASLQSPFYPGNTMFGGSNAANLYNRGSSLLAEASQYQVTAPKRASVQVNPSNESTTCDTTGMSHTARRILEALEQFSSPLTDAKKIPVRNIMSGNSSSISNNTTLNSSPTLSRKRMREDETASPRVGLRHLTRELTVPTVPDLLRIRRRQKLQNTTVNARKIMSARTAPATLTTQEYHIRTEDDSEPKRKAPLKAKKKTNLEEQETVEAVNLPSIALPISNLPRFDISLPPCPKPDASSDKQIQQQSKQQIDKSSAFKFASPIKLTDSANNLESINNFTFSKPMSPSKVNFAETNDSYELSRTLSVGSNDTLTSQPSFPNFIWSGPSQTLKAKEKENKPKIPSLANVLKSGSVMDFFAKQSAAPSSTEQSSVWECNECLIKNNGNETYCAACKNTKHDSSDDIEILECPSEDPKSLEENKLSRSSTMISSSLHSITNNPLDKLNSSSHGSIVNKSKSSEPAISTLSKPISTAANESLNSSNTSQLNVVKPAKPSWECPCCMVHNADTVSICPCCNTAKPGSINVSPKRKIETSAPAATTLTSGFGDKFKKPEGSWSCDVCMLQNKSDASKCVACETPRPNLAKTNVSSASLNSGTSTTLSSSFGDKFKKPEGSWTCDTCMVQNKSDVNKCVACETPRAGAATDSAPSKSSSKLQFNVDMPANAGSFKFGIDKADNPTNLPVTTPKTNGFTFGTSTSSSQPTSGGFSFGMPSDTNKSKEPETSKAPTFGFKSDTVATTATFQFGAKPVETKDKEEKTPAASAVFQFGAGTADVKDKKDTNSTATFSFGAQSKPDATKVPSAAFVFGAPATAPENNDGKKSDTAPAERPFAFGAQTATTQTAKDSTADKTAKSTTDTPANQFLFGSLKPSSDAPKLEVEKSLAVETVSKLEPSKSTLFGAPTEQSKPAAPTFSFGSSATSATTVPSSSTTSASLFSFGAQAKATDSTTSNTTSLPAFGSASAPKPTFSFGKPAESTGMATTQQENKPPTMFGSATASPSFGGQANQTTPSLFGSSVPSTNASETKSLLFGGPEKKNASGFGEPNSKVPNFGSTTTTKSETSGFGTVSPAPSAFGVPTTSTSTAALPFGTTPSLFGNGAAPSFSATPTPNMFSATTKSSETTSSSSGLFTFGQSSQATTPATGGFNFSAGSNTASNADQQKSIFSFGASSNNSQQQVGNGFNGGSFSGVSATPTANFTFNPPPKPDTSATTGLFGQTATAASTTRMFNAPSNTAGQPTGLPPAYPGTTSSTPAASSGFNFGSTNLPNSFSFGNSPAPSTGGFNFNAPSTPAAGLAFDPNAQPTFNFTAGSAPTAFNAPPTRKIKKAIRRMPRQ